MIAEEFKIRINLLVGDLHFGISNNSNEWFVRSYEYVINFLMPVLKQVNSKYGAENVVVTFMGDQSDNKQSINTYIQNMMIDLFVSLSLENKIIVIVGNHDSPMKNDISVNSNKSFGLINNVEVCDKMKIFVDEKNRKHAFIPFISNFMAFKALISDLEKMDVKYIYGHNAISGFHYEGKEVEKENHVSIEDLKSFNHVWMGHIHKKQNKENVTFVGSGYHTKSSENKNVVGLTLVDFNLDKTYFIENTYSPKFKTVNFDHIVNLKVSEANKLVKNNYVSILLPNSVSTHINTSKINAVLDGYKNIEYVPIDQNVKNNTANVAYETDIDSSIYDKPIDVKSSLMNFVDGLENAFVNKQSVLLTDKMKSALKSSLNDLYELADKDIVEEIETTK